MRGTPPARRSFDVVAPITVYRVIGRRPSAVYLDEGSRAATQAVTQHRLWDRVFQEIVALPGEQIQDRSGGLLLVKADGEACAIQLSPPVPRDIGTAFVHSDLALTADRNLAEMMVSDGRLAPGSIRRIRVPLVTTPSTQFSEDHPFVTPI